MNYILNVWDSVKNKYVGIPAIKGPKGDKGDKGDKGQFSAPQIIVTASSGTTVTCTNGSKTLTGVSNGTVVFDLPDYGTWTVTAEKDGKTVSCAVAVDTVKQYSLTLSPVFARLTVTSEAGSTIVVESTSQKLSGVVGTDGTVAINILSSGSYNVYATKNGAVSKYKTSVTITDDGGAYTATAPMVGSTLEDTAWSQVSLISALGIAQQFWKVGDAKDITAGDELLTVIIVGFDHDDLSNSTDKVGITFGLRDLMANKKKINDGATVYHNETALHAYLTNDVFQSFPTDLQEAIKPVVKITMNGEINLKIFSFSPQEVGLPVPAGMAGLGGNVYPYYSTLTSRVKRMVNGKGEANSWWTRTMDSRDNTGAKWFYVSEYPGTTEAQSNLVSTTNGVCFGFGI